MSPSSPVVYEVTCPVFISKFPTGGVAVGIGTTISTALPVTDTLSGVTVVESVSATVISTSPVALIFPSVVEFTFSTLFKMALTFIFILMLLLC